MRVPPSLAAPEGAFTVPLRVRSYEVGDTGTVGLGTLLRYLELVATDHSASLGFDNRWYERNGTAWFVRAMDIWLGALPGMNVDLLVSTWVADFRRVQARREYAIIRADGGALVARASGRWGYVDRATGHPRRLEEDLASAFVVYPERTLPPVYTPFAEPPTASATMSLTARGYEAVTQGHVNNTVYADWLMEGMRRLAREHPEEQALRAMVPRRYLIEYVRPVRVGDAVTIATAAIPLSSRRLAVAQSVTSAADGALCLKAFATYLRTR
ncbi:MAG TPA: acyl-ACP thioesterase domain-containing protein [Ktedonobacterales bacterium]|nr:acyl-ACP thioesterase domain-containing protein [Ktedonobacterales bacterium]